MKGCIKNIYNNNKKTSLMKKSIMVMIAAVMMFGGTVTAQDKKSKPTLEQRIEKRTEHMQKILMLDDATAAKFAPIYKEYLKAKAESRFVCKRSVNLTDAQIKENISKKLDAKENTIKIEQKYYKKLSAILSGRQLQIIFCDNNKKAFNRNNKKAFNGRNAKCWNKKGCPMPQKNCFKKPDCPQAPANCPMKPDTK